MRNRSKINCTQSRSEIKRQSSTGPSISSESSSCWHVGANIMILNLWFVRGSSCRCITTQLQWAHLHTTILVAGVHLVRHGLCGQTSSTGSCPSVLTSRHVGVNLVKDTMIPNIWFIHCRGNHVKVSRHRWIPNHALQLPFNNESSPCPSLRHKNTCWLAINLPSVACEQHKNRYQPSDWDFKGEMGRK
jgi:hypothetical protein